ncbi:hypothetical protein ACFFRR_003044 [Megaselia abdita]
MSKVVHGEAEESEDEFDSKFQIPQDAGEAEIDEEAFEAEPLAVESLLQKKLVEENINLWSSLNSTIKSNVNSASKQLTNTDQLLLKSQITMQSLSQSLRSTKVTTSELSKKFKNIACDNFIPEIRI